MERHLKTGLVFAIVFTFFLIIQGAISLTGSGKTFLGSIAYAVSIPLVWFWNLFGFLGDQVMGHLVFLVLSAIVYYFSVSFFVGVLFSAVIEAVITAKENRHYSKASSELENDSSDS